MRKYQDATLSPEERAKDLLSLMNTREKVGQLNQRLYGFRIYKKEGDEFHLTEEFKEEVEYFGGIGVLYGLYRADPWSARNEENGIGPEVSAKAYNTVQRYVIEHSRLGIPMLLSTECPHGHQALGGGILPVNLAAGASFHPDLLKEAYRTCGEQLKDGHVDFALMSVLDILRDPRWGRSEECYSEDPYLSAAMAQAAVLGMQEAGVEVVAKHFCAQGEGTGGVNASAARIGERELREIHLPAMKACVDGGVRGVMVAYNEIDGVFCHANAWLLKKVLRQEMGFQGVVMADGLAIDNLNAITGDYVASGATALRAGVDISLWDKAFSRLDEAVEKGLVTMEELDQAVLRVLTIKFRRGLFEEPYMKENMKSYTAYGTDKISLTLARESVILVKNNDSLLPLNKRRNIKIAVTGPNADDLYCQMGDYTPPMSRDDGITVLEGLLREAGECMEVIKLKGCGLTLEPDEAVMNQNLFEDLETVKACDLVVAVLGGSSSRYEGAAFDANGAAVAQQGRTKMDCGEGVDSSELALPWGQLQYIKKLKEAQIPIIGIVIQGRPYALVELEKFCDALLLAFYPGPYGGKALAEIIYGKIAPSGRLPVSLPRHPGQLPVYYNYKGSYSAMTYHDCDPGPLYTFGEGLTYTDFEYSDFSVQTYQVTDVVTEQTDFITVNFKVKNRGQMGAHCVPQLYIRGLTSSIVRRVRELKGFTKLYLNPGEEREAALTLKIKDLMVWGINRCYVLEPGEAELYLCDQGREYYRQKVYVPFEITVK